MLLFSLFLAAAWLIFFVSVSCTSYTPTQTCEANGSKILIILPSCKYFAWPVTQSFLPLHDIFIDKFVKIINVLRFSKLLIFFTWYFRNTVFFLWLFIHVCHILATIISSDMFFLLWRHRQTFSVLSSPDIVWMTFCLCLFPGNLLSIFLVQIGP